MIEQLPPRKPLPPAVRERMRRKIMAGHGGARTPMAAAVAVTVLVAGGAILAQSTQGADTAALAPPSTTSSAPRGPLEPDLRAVPASAEDLRLCEFTHARFTVPMPGRRLVWADEGFCELTYTTVAKSKTSGALSGQEGMAVQWRSPTGVVVGQAPKGTAQAEATVTWWRERVSVLLHQGRFVLAPGPQHIDLTFTSEDLRRTTERIDAATTPGDSTVREVFPRPDPTEQDKMVARCLDHAMRQNLPGAERPEAWRAGALASAAPGTGLLVLRDGIGETLYCQLANGMPETVNLATRGASRGVVLMLDSAHGGPSALDAYVGGRVDDRVASMVVTYRDKQGAVSVVDGTFAVHFAEGTSGPGYELDVTKLHVRALDAAGAVLHDGPLMP
ncbi:hypothetical protein [Saccharothrix coeruleofusca]|uniref:Uncharacterized protein n=1 Tax=Saccharothrix coeruleofusca TaxID=33919 RepID=A0A918ARH7_9PSEU|nr:hypothetical protein [Saccharothrix coeruleofusca]MBP2337820.1 hypothetical protein [Saccharothrix coeruleofusca]GGP62491.1 hypothetical protein GCM10010185_38670 [Saccharothrix coeruleofusca]